MAWAYGQWRRSGMSRDGCAVPWLGWLLFASGSNSHLRQYERTHTAASPLPLAALLHAATALVLLLLLCAGHARADTSTAPIAAAAAGDKAAADRSSMGRPRLVDGGFPAMAAARHWVLGDKAYIGMLAGHDGGCAVPWMVYGAHRPYQIDPPNHPSLVSRFKPHIKTHSRDQAMRPHRGEPGGVFQDRGEQGHQLYVLGSVLSIYQTNPLIHLCLLTADQYAYD